MERMERPDQSVDKTELKDASALLDPVLLRALADARAEVHKRNANMALVVDGCEGRGALL